MFVNDFTECGNIFRVSKYTHPQRFYSLDLCILNSNWFIPCLSRTLTLQTFFPPVEVNNCVCLRKANGKQILQWKRCWGCFPEVKMCYSILSSFCPCSEMLNSDEEQGVGQVNERETERGEEEKKGLIWRLHAATISSTQNGQTHCWNMHESFPSGGWGVRERSRERSSLFIKLHETALRD